MIKKPVRLSLSILLALTMLAFSQPSISGETQDYSVLFRERLVQWIALLEETLAGHEAEIKKTEEIQREAEEYLRNRQVRANSELFATFYEAKTAAGRVIRTHNRTRRLIRSRIRRIQAVQSHLSTETISAEQGVTLEFLGPVRIERQGQDIVGPGGSGVPFIINPGDFIEVGENGELTFLQPEIGAELSVKQNTRVLYEKVAAGESPRLKLLEGKVRFEASKKYRSFMKNIVNPVSQKLQVLKPRPRFRISTQGAAVAVRGTAFTFEYDPDGRTTIILWEGTLDLTPWDKADEIILTAPARIVVGPDRVIEGPVPLTPEELERISADAYDD